MKDGRPLRFLGGTLGGWTLLRIVQLWPDAGTPPLRSVIESVLPPVAAHGLSTPITLPPIAALSRVVPPARRSAPSTPAVPIVPPSHRSTFTVTRGDAVQRQVPALGGIIGSPVRPTPIARGPGRLAGSAWMLARGGPSGTLSGGQLGASQAGLRLTYALGHARRIAIAVRIATPLSGAGKEAALGIEWTPTRLPFRVIAEQRVVLDGGRGGPTIGIVGGYGPGLVAPGLRVEAYGQAGAIARGGIEGFVDAAMRATHPLVDQGPVRIDIGTGVWGSAQKGAARLDLGLTIGAAVPIGRHVVRLSADCGIM